MKCNLCIRSTSLFNCFIFALTFTVLKVSTNEEDKNEILKLQAKLFRYDPTSDSSEWKERGAGDGKLLKHETKHTVGVVMRRDKTEGHKNMQIGVMQSQQQPQNQNAPQLTVSSVSQTVSASVQKTVTVSQPTVAAPLVAQKVVHNLSQGMVIQTHVQGQRMDQSTRERSTIWQGILEWWVKTQNLLDTLKETRQVPCHMSANTKCGEPELKTDAWPQKLLMQLMPTQLIGSIGGICWKNLKSVVFHPTPCEALESLTKIMSTGFAGCVHITSGSSIAACDIKVLIRLYTSEKRAYIGIIPNDQASFVDRFKKVIQHQKTTQALTRPD